MGRNGISAPARGHYEGNMVLQFLPRCPGCGLPHPRAQKLDTDTCPSCGTNCPTGETQEVPAAITGWAPWAIAARFFLWAGRVLANIARSI